MTTLYNQISINASPEAVWHILSDLGRLEKYDPVVKGSRVLGKAVSGLNAQRHCDTRNGWFKEEVSEWKPYETLAFTLFDCNLPIKVLTHAYRLESRGTATLVSQTMTHTMKYGLIGNLIDLLMVRKQSNKGIKLFFEGLKQEVEKEND
ncbi:MAG: hypothetical protein Roseis2KO_57470 [Roseivirga sp.]